LQALNSASIATANKKKKRELLRQIKGVSILLVAALAGITTARLYPVQGKARRFMDAKELAMTSLLIEGHRDVYEQISCIGEESPIRDAVAPR
jgi:hypothetical protein